MIHSCRCFLHLQRTELHRTDSFDPEYIKQKTLTPQFLRGKLTAVPVNMSLKIPKMVLKEHFLKIPNHCDDWKLIGLTREHSEFRLLSEYTRVIH